MTATVLGFDAAVPLVASTIVRRAEASGHRVLCIKGPFLAAQGLRRAKTSVDLDVLLHPDDVDPFVAVLERDGWQRRDPVGVRYKFEQHSVTMVHPYWPCMIDVHRFWVGFLRPAADVFDALWARRETVAIAGTEAPTPDASVAAVLLALNELRSAPEASLDGLLDDLVERARARLGGDPAAGERLDEAAVLVGAEYTAGPLLRRFGLERPLPDDPEPALRDWLLRQEIGSESTAGWLYLAARTPWHRRPMVLIDALALSPRALRALRPDAAPGFRGFWSAWFSRLGKGVRHLGRAREVLARTRHPRK